MTFTCHAGTTTCDHCGQPIDPPTWREKAHHEAIHAVAAAPDAPDWLTRARRKHYGLPPTQPQPGGTA